MSTARKSPPKHQELPPKPHAKTGKPSKAAMKAASKPLGYAKMETPPKGCRTK